MAEPRPKPRYAAFRRVRHPDTADLLDEALVLWLPGPRTETGEDMAELQVHGSPAVIRAVLAALALMPGCRMAEAGEFARRAFENGRLDLTAAEGLADLIDAETEAQRRQALAQASGALARLYDAWRERLVSARALVEAAIDFSDEADVAADALVRGRADAAALAIEVHAHLSDANRGEIVREGFRIVLAGPANVGKSNLLNTLARRDVAIVSSEAGTTRDVIEVRLNLGGYAVVVTDTAGIREPSGPVEAEGIRRTLRHARDADLLLWVVDATAPEWQPPADIAAREPTLVVVNKIDLAPTLPVRAPGTPDAITVSALTGAGMERLVARIATAVADRLSSGERSIAPPPTQARHLHHLDQAYTALARLSSEPDAPAELQAEELRLASDALGRIIGRIDAEQVLSRIFGRFCIGK